MARSSFGGSRFRGGSGEGQSGRSPVTESMGLVMDTSALVELERRGPEWAMTDSPLFDEPAVIAAIAYAEVMVGVRLADPQTSKS